MATARVERYRDFPAQGTPVWHYPPGRLETFTGDGTLLKLTDRQGSERLCTIAYADERIAVSADPFVLPDGRHVYANGLVLDADEPSRCRPLEVEPIRAIKWSPARHHVVFIAHLDVAAYGPSGFSWRRASPDLDELECDRIDDQTVSFRGLLLWSNECRRWVVDLASGATLDAKPC